MGEEAKILENGAQARSGIGEGKRAPIEHFQAVGTEEGRISRRRKDPADKDARPGQGLWTGAKSSSTQKAFFPMRVRTTGLMRGA